MTQRRPTKRAEPPTELPPQAGPSNGKQTFPSTGSDRRKQAEVANTYDPEQLKQLWEKYACDLTYDWADEDEVDIFRRALEDDTGDDGYNSPGIGGPGSGHHTPTAKIRAISDFAPINQRISSKRGKRRDIVREGWAYHVSRWPLLGIICLVIALEFMGYLLVRQLVNVIEYFSTWGGRRGDLRMKMRQAKTYDEWKTYALALDEHLSYAAWKHTPSNAYYDAPLVRRVLRSLRSMRSEGNMEGIRAVLEVCLRSNFAGIEGVNLYAQTYYGTKELIEEFLDEVAGALEYMRNLPEEKLPAAEKLRFFRHVSKNLGASALCLSGGAAFGYYHFGVVREILDADLMPKVVTGTSAGALIAAFVCTRTDEELKQMIIPELADRIDACYEPFNKWVRRWWRTGARFDTLDWARKCSFFTMGGMTFKQAFERTGRILNVSVIPYDAHSPTKLLNYLTAPDCLIYTAVIASAAVPGILNPVILMTRDKNGTVRGWDFEGKHKDGSLRVDIPLQSLHLMYNVNFSIVSQVNPHIHLFNFAPRGSPGRPVAHRRGKGWRGGFFLSAAEQLLKLELTKNFRVMRDLELMPELAGQNWSAVFLQKFEGTVTIWPKSRLWDWFRILSDPDPKELARMIRVGQVVTWPKLHMIENRMKVERQIDLGREEAYEALAPSPMPGHVHRGSSFDIDRPAAVMGGKSPKSPNAGLGFVEESAIDDDEDEDSADEGSAVKVTERSGLSPEETKKGAKRRQAILAKLGLGPSSIGSGSSGKGTATPTEQKLKRRFSMGTLRLAPQVRGAGGTVFGSKYADSSDEDSAVDRGGYSSAGSSNKS